MSTHVQPPKIGRAALSARVHGPPSIGRAALHLAALWALAFVQPLLDLLGRSPEFFVAHGNTGSDIAIFSIVVAFGPPAVGVAAEAVAGLLDSRLGRRGWVSIRGVLHLALVAALGAALVLQLVDSAIGSPAGLKIAVAVVAGLALAFACVRTSFAPSALDVLSVAPILFVGLFFFSSRAGDLIFAGESAKAAEVNFSRPAPVLMIVFDEFPNVALMNAQGGIDRSLFPGFAKLAGSSTWYRNGMSDAALTEHAVPAILTGNRSDGTRLPTFDDQPDNVFTLLGGSYDLRVIEPVTNLCPPELCGEEDRGGRLERLRSLIDDSKVVSQHLLLPASLRNKLPPINSAFSDFAPGARPFSEITAGNRSRLADLEHFKESLGGGDARPFFSFLHVQFPHRPWDELPDGRTYPRLNPNDSRVGGIDNGPFIWGDDPAAVLIGEKRLLLQTGFVDRAITEVIGRLKQAGIWRQAEVVVTADHGMAFVANQPGRGPTAQTAGWIGNVPLFIKAAGQTHGVTSDAPVRAIDIVPTLADHLGTKLPFKVDGEPAEDAPRSRPLRMYRGAGGQFELSFARFTKLRDRTTALKARSFGSEQGWERVLRAGPGGELIDRRVESLDQLGGVGKGASLNGPDAYRGLGDSGPIPIHVSGSIDGPIEGQTPLAVAIDGRIAGVGASYRLDGEAGFQAIVDPAYLGGDPARIELFELLGGERLRSLGRLL